MTGRLCALLCRAEACVALYLDANAANSNSQAILLKGIFVNQDGRSSSLTAPNGPSQQAVIRAAIDNASLTPADIAQLELHGTGTPLGDPIELGAATAVFQGLFFSASCVLACLRYKCRNGYG